MILSFPLLSSQWSFVGPITYPLPPHHPNNLFFSWFCPPPSPPFSPLTPTPTPFSPPSPPTPTHPQCLFHLFIFIHNFPSHSQKPQHFSTKDQQPKKKTPPSHFFLCCSSTLLLQTPPLSHSLSSFFLS